MTTQVKRDRAAVLELCLHQTLFPLTDRPVTHGHAWTQNVCVSCNPCTVYRDTATFLNFHVCSVTRENANFNSRVQNKVCICKSFPGGTQAAAGGSEAQTFLDLNLVSVSSGSLFVKWRWWQHLHRRVDKIHWDDTSELLLCLTHSKQTVNIIIW